MSGRCPTKKQKLAREKIIPAICPYCSENFPTELLCDHIGICESNYLVKRKRARQLKLLPFQIDGQAYYERSRKNGQSTPEKLPYKTLDAILEADENKNEMVTPETSSLGPQSKGANRLIENLESLLRTKWCCDVILTNTDHEFRAHRLILGARSPVFASMFQHDMLERKTGRVDISDCSRIAFEAFLQFLYTGNADITLENVADLYYVADKYQVDDLKADCAEYLKNSLSKDTFCDIIALSIRHSESELLSVATQFFCRNIKTIVKTIRWQEYLTENPTHANELIIKAINA